MSGSRQIEQMCKFILQEANEKANEIRIKTEHDFHKDKQLRVIAANKKTDGMLAGAFRVFRSWGVEIVGDLCLLHGHQLVGSLRRTMEELLGEDDAKICYQFLEPMIEIATELLT